jgi:orotate phosphoribosyltransferase
MKQPMIQNFFTDTDRDELIALIRERSFRFGQFTLASGRTSNLYFNLKPTMLHPRGAELGARGLLAQIAPLRPDYVAGLELGAIPPIASLIAVGSQLGVPLHSFFVRKAAKDHGTQQLVEGLAPDETLNGCDVVMIDDVATTGGSTLKAIEVVRAAGGIVDHAVCLLDREEGAAENLAAHGVTLHRVLAAHMFGDAV